MFLLLLTEALQTPCPATQTWAAEALGKLGPQARDAVPALVRLCRAKDWRVREAARRAVHRLDPTVPVPPPAPRPGRRFFRALLRALGAWHV
jgi:HEAT repeat protein